MDLVDVFYADTLDTMSVDVFQIHSFIVSDLVMVNIISAVTKGQFLSSKDT